MRNYIDPMRQNLGLEAGDASRDADIESMTPEQRLGLVCGWHLGDRSWARTFLSWARDAGYKISEPKTRS